MNMGLNLEDQLQPSSALVKKSVSKVSVDENKILKYKLLEEILGNVFLKQR